MIEKQQSPNWEDYCNSGFIKEGFPFDEGFPSGGPFGNENKFYELITRDGSRIQAQVDYSTQYRAEGLQWRVKGRSLERSVIVAWREL